MKWLLCIMGAVMTLALVGCDPNAGPTTSRYRMPNVPDPGDQEPPYPPATRTQPPPSRWNYPETSQAIGHAQPRRGANTSQTAPPITTSPKAPTVSRLSQRPAYPTATPTTTTAPPATTATVPPPPPPALKKYPIGIPTAKAPTTPSPNRSAVSTQDSSATYPGGSVRLLNNTLISSGIGLARSTNPQDILLAKRAAYVVAIRNAGLFLGGFRMVNGELVGPTGQPPLGHVKLNVSNFKEASSWFDKAMQAAHVTIEIPLE